MQLPVCCETGADDGRRSVGHWPVTSAPTRAVTGSTWDGPGTGSEHTARRQAATAAPHPGPAAAQLGAEIAQEVGIRETSNGTNCASDVSSPSTDERKNYVSDVGRRSQPKSYNLV